MSKKKNNKNVYQRGKVSTVQKPTRDKSKDKIYAIILCVFIVFWTIASVLGSIGFFRTNAEEVSVAGEFSPQGYIYETELDALNQFITVDNEELDDTLFQTKFSLRFFGDERFLIADGVSYPLAGSSSTSLTVQTFTPASDIYYNKVIGVRAVQGANTTIQEFPLMANGRYYPAYWRVMWHNTYTMRIEITEKSLVNNPDYIWYLLVDLSDVLYNSPSGFTDYRYFIPLGGYYESLTTLSSPVQFNGTNFEDYMILYYNQQAKFDDGYAQGKQVGYNDGYSIGYNDGINDSNSYSFSNMIGAVLDGQVNMFMGLFNFELLGVNLSSFFLAILTVCVIITIIKLLM